MLTPAVDRSRALEEFRFESGKKVFLVIGGSLGARTLNHSIRDGLDRFGRDDLQLLWQSGKTYHTEADDLVRQKGLKNIRVEAFITRMDLAYTVADVIVSRAGGISISELCIVGKPVILVPSPNVAEDHQTRNAEALVSRKAAVLVPDHLAGETLVQKMLDLMEDEKRKVELSENIQQLGIPDASQRIASEVINIVEQS
jgi:UDP-N-acetylglucosamine--N-acetylmuramyl-(pentapeptide) pyrophosphoryl-undecaprenol N-acetylglucosamine transferase